MAVINKGQPDQDTCLVWSSAKGNAIHFTLWKEPCRSSNSKQTLFTWKTTSTMSSLSTHPEPWASKLCLWHLLAELDRCSPWEGKKKLLLMGGVNIRQQVWIVPFVLVSEVRLCWVIMKRVVISQYFSLFLTVCKMTGYVSVRKIFTLREGTPVSFPLVEWKSDKPVMICFFSIHTIFRHQSCWEIGNNTRWSSMGHSCLSTILVTSTLLCNSWRMCRCHCCPTNRMLG